MTLAQTIVAWLMTLVFMTHPANKVHPGDEAKQAEYVQHVREVVTDIQQIVYEPQQVSWFGGPYGRAYEAALVTIISSEESGGYNLDVESGKRRGDSGSSWCIMAINVGKGKTAEGWTGPDLVADRKKCLRAGLRLMRMSLNGCRKYGTQSGLSIYDTGSCIENESISVRRIKKLMWVVNKKVPMDSLVLLEQKDTYQGDKDPVADAGEGGR